MTALTFYYRSGCSLCEVMHGELLRHPLVDSQQLACIDIDRSRELVERYDHKVPVLTGAADEEICHYFLDEQALQDYLATH